MGTPASVRTFRTTAAPPADVPCPCVAPSCLRTSSAVKLSLQLSMYRRIFQSGAEVTCAIGTDGSVATPCFDFPATVTPAPLSACLKSAAAASAGRLESWPLKMQRSTVSAERAGDSPP